MRAPIRRARMRLSRALHRGEQERHRDRGVNEPLSVSPATDVEQLAGREGRRTATEPKTRKSFRALDLGRAPPAGGSPSTMAVAPMKPRFQPHPEQKSARPRNAPRRGRRGLITARRSAINHESPIRRDRLLAEIARSAAGEEGGAETSPGMMQEMPSAAVSIGKPASRPWRRGRRHQEAHQPVGDEPGADRDQGSGPGARSRAAADRRRRARRRRGAAAGGPACAGAGDDEDREERQRALRHEGAGEEGAPGIASAR